MTQETIRGIDHVGIGVPNLEDATRFLELAFGAKVIYTGLKVGDTALSGELMEKTTGAAKGARVVAIRAMTMGRGPTLELIETTADDQARADRVSDLGLNHLSLYTDDAEAAIGRFTKAGGVMRSGPLDAILDGERGPGNVFCYGLTPWGMSVEFVSYPKSMSYENETDLRRWHRGS